MSAQGTQLPVSFLDTCRSDMQNEWPLSRSLACVHRSEASTKGSRGLQIRLEHCLIRYLCQTSLKNRSIGSVKPLACACPPPPKYVAITLTSKGGRLRKLQMTSSPLMK